MHIEEHCRDICVQHVGFSRCLLINIKMDSRRARSQDLIFTDNVRTEGENENEREKELVSRI